MINNIDVEFEIKLKGAATLEELLTLAKSKGYNLSNEQLEATTDSSDALDDCSPYDDRPSSPWRYKD